MTTLLRGAGCALAADIQEALDDNGVPFRSRTFSFGYNVVINMGDNVHRYMHSALCSGTPSSHFTGGTRVPMLASGYINRVCRRRVEVGVLGRSVTFKMTLDFSLPDPLGQSKWSCPLNTGIAPTHYSCQQTPLLKRGRWVKGGRLADH